MKSLSGKLIPVALIPVLITGMLPLTALSANAGQAPVFYLDRQWDENDHTLNEMLRVTPRNAAELSRYTTKLEDGRWYYTCSDSDNTISHRITVHGNVSLILSDNTDLNIPKGIDIPEGSTLTIYGGNYGTGSMSIRAPQEYDAAIGGGKKENGGSLIVKGGNITARSTSDAPAIGASAIGHGTGKSKNGTLSILDNHWVKAGTKEKDSKRVESSGLVSACHNNQFAMVLPACEHPSTSYRYVSHEYHEK